MIYKSFATQYMEQKNISFMGRKLKIKGCGEKSYQTYVHLCVLRIAITFKTIKYMCMPNCIITLKHSIVGLMILVFILFFCCSTIYLKLDANKGGMWQPDQQLWLLLEEYGELSSYVFANSHNQLSNICACLIV
jgi:hypothetical protein